MKFLDFNRCIQQVFSSCFKRTFQYHLDPDKILTESKRSLIQCNTVQYPFLFLWRSLVSIYASNKIYMLVGQFMLMNVKNVYNMTFLCFLNNVTKKILDKIDKHILRGFAGYINVILFKLFS